MKQRYLANRNVAPISTEIGFTFDDTRFVDPFYPRFWPSRLDEDLGICRGIFVVDMGDLFGIGVPEEWTRGILDRIRRSSHRNRYYLLTKQPQNLAKFSPFPENCWVGVTATDYMMLATACSDVQHIKAKVKYISFEPLLGMEWGGGNLTFWLTAAGINWIIIGAQTKPYKPPKIEWVREIVKAADEAKIPIFLKDNLFPLVNSVDMVDYRNLWSGGKENKFDAPLRLRQEMPK